MQPAITPDVIDHDAAAAFVEKFQDGWRTPDLRKHEALWSDQIVLTQPLLGTLRGRDECRAAFARLFELVPDIHATVHRWSAGDDAIFIEFTLSGTFGGRELAWTAVDRFTLVNGLIAERISYFDSAPLALAMAGRPRGWRRLLGTRFVPRFERYVQDSDA
ncbi:nuclear transport factor 2 family protein [Nonomuraea sp. NPDC049695]|uniref:nuclear transport factor 2 family protein n=1 Tax=Nonomuraea sp. NPDC049695 TaxID=3154734 RepID=UPI00341EAC1D